MRTLGLTGTVGSGKSYALSVLEDLGAVGLKADLEGHRLLEDEEVIREVVDLLGDGVLTSEGSLDRAKIGELVFTDAEKREAYDKLIRPRLLSRIKIWLDEPGDGGRVRVVEAALIPEWGIEDWFDEVWCIKCSDSTALSRWSRDPELYWKIRRAQFAPERKQQKAERVIENENSKEDFRDRIHNEWRKVRRDAGR
ncbi:MAG: dephospho-CoA kinase [Candidatus Omnitrophica bacterium]|nr:dephospho-CoA kinase [Candidatus Omnitrophota bacterium]